jgi:hypothetical protein
MPTNTPGTTARQSQVQAIHFLRRSLTFGDNGIARTVGIIPAGAQIIQPLSGVYVTTAFNAGTTNVLDIGTSADDDLYATDLALGTRAFVAIDEAATAVNTWLVTADTTITATVALAGTAATAGAAEVVIAYVPDTDG